jgi:hypothetical protein
MAKKLHTLSLGVCATIASITTAWANAPANRYTVSAGTVRDTKTGLVWQQPFKTGMLLADARNYCASQGGSWRLPTIKELITIYDYSYPGGGTPGNVFLDPAFGKVASDDATFWSSTPTAGVPGTGWGVLFEVWITNVVTLDLTGKASVRCVS